MRFAGILLSGKQPGPPVLPLQANPCPLEGGRHGAQLQRPRVVARQKVLRKEEEQLVTVAVEDGTGHEDRTADRPRRVVEPVRGFRAAGDLARVALTPTVPRVRIEL